MGGGKRLISLAAKRAEKERKARLSRPLVDSIKSKPITPVERLFSLVDTFEKERRRQEEAVREAERATNLTYQKFSAEERVEFFAMLYDRFAENYDLHMEKTGHYEAVRRLLGFVSEDLSFPLVDLTAGTGEPLRYALGLMKDRKPEKRPKYLTFVNEISPKMLEKAKEKLKEHKRIRFTGFNAYKLPPHLKGRFRTALCSQTLHLISDEDKPKLVQSMHKVLAPGGIAVVIEEDPFLISSTPEIGVVRLLINSVAAPIKHVSDLIGRFESMGFKKLDTSAVVPIDKKHAMRLYTFQKASGTPPSEDCIHGAAYSSPG